MSGGIIKSGGDPPELFADGVLDVGYAAGVVRIDLFSLSATARDAHGRPEPVLRQRVAMTLPGFLSGLAMMEGMRRRLEESGAIPPAPPSPLTPSPLTPPPAQPFSPPAAPVSAAPAPDQGPRSPNFGD